MKKLHRKHRTLDSILDSSADQDGFNSETSYLDVQTSRDLFESVGLQTFDDCTCNWVPEKSDVDQIKNEI